jgi:hypothetical protein
VILVIIIAAMLLALNILLAAAVFYGKPPDINGLKSFISQGYRKALTERMKFMAASRAGKGIINKMQLMFIEKSNIRRFIPFMDIKHIILASAVLFAVVLKPLYDLLLFLPTSAIISLMFSLTPFLILDLMAKYNAEVIRRGLAEFISILNRWCKVKEDLFYAFEKSIDSGIGQPLKTFISETVIQVKRGLDPGEALDLLQAKVDNVQFKDFVLNVKQSIKHWVSNRFLAARGMKNSTENTSMDTAATAITPAVNTLEGTSDPPFIEANCREISCNLYVFPTSWSCSA